MGEAEQHRFGDVIREARKKQGWSQVELGEKAGVSRPTIARVEGNNDVTTATIAKVAQALGLKFELRDDGCARLGETVTARRARVRLPAEADGAEERAVVEAIGIR